MYKYYLLLRPVGPGCQPKGFSKYESYPRRIYIPEIKREAWSAVWYDRKLTEEEISGYDLVKAE